MAKGVQRYGIRKAPVVFTPERRLKFLEHLEKHGLTTAAADHACVSRHTIYRTIEEDSQFAADYEDARARHTEAMEAEGFRRAKDGVLRDRYYKDQVVGQERVYSDRLLELVLKAKCGWTEKQEVDVAIAGGVLVVGPLADPNDPEAWRRRHNKPVEAKWKVENGKENGENGHE
jgi:hypothetical protein